MTQRNLKSGPLIYRIPTIEDAELLMDWRTRPEITRYMFTDIEPDLERQRAWLAGTAAKPGFTHRLILVDTHPVGYCSITVTDEAAGIGTIGVYLAEKSSRSGIALFNFVNLLNHAFFPLGLYKIVNQILGANARVIRSQEWAGYRSVGVLKGHFVKGGERHDVHLFEQRREDWLSYRPRFGDLRDLDGREWPDA